MCLPIGYFGAKARIYRNLHKDCLSMQFFIKGQGWRVRSYPFLVLMKDVKFIVSDAGRRRTLKEGRKNVHAFVEGELIEANMMIGGSLETNVSYNPKKHNFFYFTEDEERIDSAPWAMVTTKGVVVDNRKEDFVRKECRILEGQTATHTR